MRKGRLCSRPLKRNSFTIKELLLRLLLLGPVSRLYRRTDARQQVFGTLGVWAIWGNLQIFLEGFGRAWRSNRLVPLQSSFPEQVHTLLVIRLCPARIGSNALVEGCICIVDPARIRINGSDVEVGARGCGRISFRCGLVTLHSVVDLV